MSDMRSQPIDLLEVSVLSQEIFAHLGLKTIGDIADTTEADFYAAAEALSDGGGRPWRKAGKEVQEILGDMGLSLKRP